MIKEEDCGVMERRKYRYILREGKVKVSVVWVIFPHVLFCVNDESGCSVCKLSHYLLSAV